MDQVAASSLAQTHADPLSTRVSPISVVADVADRFRRSVISGSLRPGEEIIESQVAERLGIARSTLREAISILVGEGLLEKLPNRAPRVRRLTPDKAWEIMTARAVIESFAARVLAERLTPDKAAHLRAAWDDMNRAALDNDCATFLSRDFTLHQAIVELSGHELLYEMWTKISAWIRLMFAAEQYDVAEMAANAENHRRFVEAIASGDPDAAESSLRADLLDQRELRRVAELCQPGTERWAHSGKEE